MRTELTLSQRIHNAKTSSEVEKLKAFHAYTHGASRSAEEWGNIWSCEDDIAWGHIHGRMRGFVHVWFGNVIAYDWHMYMPYAEMLLGRFPQISGRDPRPFAGVAFHPLCSGVIEVAKDGETARASYITPGMMICYMNTRGPKWGNMLWERYGADFRYEDGKLLYIHEQVQPDFMDDSFDVHNFAHDQWLEFTDPQPHGPMEPPPGANMNMDTIWTDPGPLCRRAGLMTPVHNLTPWPEPYETLSNRDTYSQWLGYPD